jgi:ribosomal protein S14
MRTDLQPAVYSYPKVTQDGMYIKPDGRIFKVQWNRASGDGRRLYAKQLVVRVLEGGRAHTQMYGLLDVLKESISPLADMDFVYASGAILMLRPEERMSLEQAARFGKLYGRCVRCGRELTDETSIERAMGRVCAGKL